MLFSTPAHCSGKLIAGQHLLRRGEGGPGVTQLPGISAEAAEIEQALPHPVLRVRPIQRRVLGGQHLQRRALGLDRALPGLHRVAVDGGERLQRRAQIGLGERPLLRVRRARIVLERVAVGFERLAQAGILLEVCGEMKRGTEIVVGCSIVERHARFGVFLERSPEGRGRLLEFRRVEQALAGQLQHRAEIVLRGGPIERASLAREDGQAVAQRLLGEPERIGALFVFGDVVGGLHFGLLAGDGRSCVRLNRLGCGEGQESRLIAACAAE
jgi:hypothetical protein